MGPIEAALTTPIVDAYGFIHLSLLEYFEHEAGSPIRFEVISLRQAIATRDYLRKLIEDERNDRR